MAFYDWQSNKSVIECNKQMFQNELLCDVSFRVGMEKQIIKAHKYVLASRSCVFYAMFADGMREGQGEVIDIPDIEPAIFRTVMQFLYTGDSDVGLENCLKVLDAAKTYAVQGLVDKCLNIMKASMTPESVCRVMEIGHVNRNEELRHRCLNFIVRDPQKVFASEGMVELCSDCLCLILEDERLSLNEEFIFHAALKYVESKCSIFSIEPTAENKQMLLGDARSQIRFPCMSAEFFSEIVQPSGILTDGESVKVFKYFINPAEGCNLFKTTPRNMLKKAHRFREIAKGWGYKRDKQDAITFRCSHDIMVKGVELFSTVEETANYEVTLILAELPRFVIISRKYAIVETDSKEQTYNLMFDEPVIVRKNQEYAICLVCRGPPTYYGLGGIPLVHDGEITFHFLKNERSTNNTNVDRGQIASVLYSLLPRLIQQPLTI